MKLLSKMDEICLWLRWMVTYYIPTSSTKQGHIQVSSIEMRQHPVALVSPLLAGRRVTGSSIDTRPGAKPGLLRVEVWLYAASASSDLLRDLKVILLSSPSHLLCPCTEGDLGLVKFCGCPPFLTRTEKKK